jgi:hypothetical protein
MGEERFDQYLLGIAQHCEGFEVRGPSFRRWKALATASIDDRMSCRRWYYVLTAFFHVQDMLAVFLGFLRRKTDAFNPPGGYEQLEKVFCGALRKQFDTAQREKKAKEAAKEKKAATVASSTSSSSKPSSVAAATSAPASASSSTTAAKPASAQTAAKTAAPAPAPQEDDVIEMGADGTFDLSSSKAPVPSATSSASTGSSSKPASTAATADADGDTAMGGTSTAPALSSAGGAASTDASASGAAAGSGNGSDHAADKKEGEGEDEEKERVPPPLGNGGSTDRYKWTQTLGEVSGVGPYVTLGDRLCLGVQMTVEFPVPGNIKSKDVTVDIKVGSVPFCLN